MFVFGVSLLRQLNFSSRHGVQKHSHQHTFRVNVSCSVPYLLHIYSIMHQPERLPYRYCTMRNFCRISNNMIWDDVYPLTILSSSSDTVVISALTSKCNPHHNRDPVIVDFHVFSRETRQFLPRNPNLIQQQGWSLHGAGCVV